MAIGENAQLEYGRELPYLNQKDSYLGSILRRIVDAVNLTATNASVSSVGKVIPPPKIDSIQVQGTLSNNVITCPSEILHWTLTHNQSVNKGVRYFSEIDTSPEFTQPHVHDHGTSRSGFLTLPTNNGAQSPVLQNYYLRSYAQYHGSDPCKPTVLGNLTGATAINMGGSSNMALLPSTGSGTASPQGQQGGKGLGTTLTRPSPRPKRSVA